MKYDDNFNPVDDLFDKKNSSSNDFLNISGTQNTDSVAQKNTESCQNINENIINDNGQPYFYFQIVLEKPEDLAISGLERGYSFLNQEGNLYSVLYDAYDYGIGPRIPMEDFTFSFRVVNIYEGRYGYINRSTDTALNHEFEQLLHNSRHNLAFSFKTNTNKQYNRSSMIRISYCIYDNLIKAMEDKDVEFEDYIHDSPEKKKKCLNCDKPECTNCLWVNV